jgi:hypothetical protein
MTIEILYSVYNPESGILNGTGGSPPSPGGFSRDRSVPPDRSLPPSAAMAKRLDTLENKTVYLVDTGFGGSYQFMMQLQKWFAEHMPLVTTIRKRKPGNVFMDDNNELWGGGQSQRKGHAVVLGVAG